MPQEKDSLTDLSSALQKKLESEGEPVTEEIVDSFISRQPLGERKTAQSSQRNPAAKIKREQKQTNLRRIITATLGGNLPVYFYFDGVGKAYSIRSMVSSYLSAEIKDRITVRIGRPTEDDSLVVVGIFDKNSVAKGWLKDALEVKEGEDE